MRRSTIAAAVGLALMSVLAACTGAGEPTRSGSHAAASLVPSSSAGPEVSADRGQQLATSVGCAACHSADGTIGVAPTWQGLYGRERPLSGGSSVLADESYLRESIIDPNAKVADGFTPGIMPQDFGERLDDDEIASIIEYIKALGDS